MTGGQLLAGIVGVAILAFILFRFFGRRGPKPSSHELVMGVWSAFGPYESVDDAEISLYRSVYAVFGLGSEKEHATWVNGHLENFRMWEKAGTFKQSVDFMCRGLVSFRFGPDFEAACSRYKEEAKRDALRLLDKITTDLGIEKEAAAAMRATIDGSMPGADIHQVLEASQQRTAERIARNIGQNILNDASEQAAGLKAFLQELSREHKGEDAITPDAIGLLYLNLLNYAGDNPDSEEGKKFNTLNDEWQATLPKDDAQAAQ